MFICLFIFFKIYIVVCCFFFVFLGRHFTFHRNNSNDNESIIPLTHSETYPHESNENFIYHQLNHTQTINNDNLQSLTSFNDIFNYSDIKQTFRENIYTILIVTLVYFLWFTLIAGIAIVHIIIYLILLLLYVHSDRTRRFGFAILIYLTYLLLYDALHLIPNYTVSTIHIEDVYLAEKRFFGIYKHGQLLTLNEYFQQNHIAFLDIFTGICYLNW